MLARQCLVGQRCGGRDAMIPQLSSHHSFSRSCLVVPTPSLTPDCPYSSKKKGGTGLLGSLSPSLTPNLRDAAGDEAAPYERSGSCVGSEGAARALLPRAPRAPPCISARHLMRAIKQSRDWQQLFHLVQAHTPLAFEPPLRSPSSSSQAASNVPQTWCHEASAHTSMQLPAHMPRSALPPAQPQQPPYLPTPDAPTINHIHLSAVLTQLAQLNADPSSSSPLQAWCMHLLQQVAQPPQLHALSVRQLANILWACARLGMHGEVLPGCTPSAEEHGQRQPASGRVRPWGGGWHAGMQARCWRVLLHAHGRRMQEALHAQQPPQQPPLSMQDVVHAVYACALAGQEPGAQWMDLALQASQPLLPQMTAVEAANWAYALSTLGASPHPGWAAAYMDATAGLLGDMAPPELVQAVHGAPAIVAAACRSVGGDGGAGLLPAGVQRWRRVCFAALARALPSLEVVHVSAALWGLSLLRWPPPPPLLAAMLGAVDGGGEGGVGAALQPATIATYALGGQRVGQAGGGLVSAPALLEASPGGDGARAAEAGMAVPQAQLSGWCAANVLTAAARLGVRPHGAWVAWLIGDVLASAGAGQQGSGGRQDSSARSSSASSSSSSSGASVSASSSSSISAPGQETPRVPSQSWQQGRHGARHTQVSARRVLADVNATMLACVLLHYHPPANVMHQLVGLALESLPWATPAQAADMLWAMAKLRYVPHRAWLAACFSSTGRTLHQQALQQLQHARAQAARQQQEQQDAEHAHQRLRQEPGAGGHGEQQQQQQQQQQLQGPVSGFDVDALCKLLWALASLSQMQHRAVRPTLTQASQPPSPPAQQPLPSRATPLPELSRSAPPPPPLLPPRQQQQQQQQQQQGSSPTPATAPPPLKARSRRRQPRAAAAALPAPHQPPPWVSAPSPPACVRTPSHVQGGFPAIEPSPVRSHTQLQPPTTAAARGAAPQAGALHVRHTPPALPTGPPPPQLPLPLPPPLPPYAQQAQQAAPPPPHSPSSGPIPSAPVDGGALPPHPSPPTAPSTAPSAYHAPTHPSPPASSPLSPAQPPPAAALSHLEPMQPSPQQQQQQVAPLPLVPPAWLEAALAVLHGQLPCVEPQHLPELVWALAALDVVPPPASRRKLAAAVAQHAAQLPPKHLAAVVGGLPRVCVTRVHDTCGMLGVVLGAGHAGLHAMKPKELTYFLRGLHGMGYVLSKKALLQLAADLAGYPLHRLAAKDLVTVVDALAGMDMGLLPATAQLPSSGSSSGNSSTTTTTTITKGSRKRHGGVRAKGHASTAEGEGGGPCGGPPPASPVLQLQQLLLSQLQPKLKCLHLTQVASLVTALSVLGWRPPSSFWPCLYASVVSKPNPASGRVAATVLLALAKYGGMAAAVEEADAVAAALRAEASAAGAGAGPAGEASVPQVVLSSSPHLAAKALLPLPHPSLPAGGRAGAGAGAARQQAAAVAQQTRPAGMEEAGVGVAGGAAAQAGGVQHEAPRGGGKQPSHAPPPADKFLLPPGMLVQRLLDFVTDDLRALRPSEVAELVLALVRLRHDPGGSWMRSLLDHLETRSAACNREDHQVLQRAWRRLSRARKAGFVRKHHHKHHHNQQQQHLRPPVSQICKSPKKLASKA